MVVTGVTKSESKGVVSIDLTSRKSLCNRHVRLPSSLEEYKKNAEFLSHKKGPGAKKEWPQQKKKNSSSTAVMTWEYEEISK